MHEKLTFLQDKHLVWHVISEDVHVTLSGATLGMIVINMSHFRPGADGMTGEVYMGQACAACSRMKGGDACRSL